MGKSQDALILILNHMEDIQRGIQFIRERQHINNSDDIDHLWNLLIEETIKNQPSKINYLFECIGLESSGTSSDNLPLKLIHFIPNGYKYEIQNLKNLLYKLVNDVHLQSSLMFGCLKIINSDCMHLMGEFYKTARRGKLVQSKDIQVT